MEGERRVLVIGGTDSPLSSASVFEFSIASHPHLLMIDPSAHSKLSSSPPSGHKFQLSLPDFLTPEEARASILVLLSKHLRGRSGSGSGCFSSSSASQITDILNNNTQTLTLDLDDDIHISKACWTDITSIGISTLLDYTASSLTKVADAVAALSCEALKADTCSVFNLFMDSGDLYDKDRAAVASDLKVLLNGSKLHSDLQFDQVNKIPIIHGHLRSLCKSINTSTRIELNSIPLVTGGVSEYLVTLFSPLAFALQDFGESSFLRAEALMKNNLFPCLVDIFNDNCPDLEKLRDSIMHFVALKMDKRYTESLHEIYVLSAFVSKILCWEAALSFISLEGNELIKAQKDIDGGNLKSGKKDKRKKITGKGTSVLIHFIKDRLQYDITSKITSSDDSDLIKKVAYSFLSLLNSKDPDFEHLLQKVKEIVDSNEKRRLPKIPKGTRDFANEHMAAREKTSTTIVNVFKRHGAMGLETPSFELRETLTEKYGEDSKLMYHLDDQGGELLTLRYDLTVPFARYVAMNGLTKYKAYQIGRVDRRDNPSKVRLREFYQGDFNISGDESIEADFEVVKVLIEVLDEIDIGDYMIKMNHRKLLDGMLEICGVPNQKLRTICSSIDKLDKQSFEEIKKEMIEEKGLDAETVEKIGSYVVLKGDPLKLLSQLKNKGSEFLKNDSANEALKDLEKLFNYLEKRKCIEKVVFDLSLARGLDYYTGVIFEAVLKEGPTDGCSIAGGGRFDNLIGMFGTKHVAAVGVGIGIDRILTIMEQLPKHENQEIRGVETEILVSVLGDDKSLAIELVDMCWAARLKADYIVSKRLTKHFDIAEKFRIPWMVIVGQHEIDKGIVTITNKQANVSKQVVLCNFVEELITLISATVLL